MSDVGRVSVRGEVGASRLMVTTNRGRRNVGFP